MNRYVRLLDVATIHADTVAAHPEPEPPHARFMWQQARTLLTADLQPDTNVRHDNAGARFAALCADRWDAIADGAGEREVLAGTGLWKPLMCEWPMGDYARLAAAHLDRRRLERFDVFEVGSGVGNLARLSAGKARTWVRSDLNPELANRQNLPGTVEEYDVREPGVPERADIVVAVNAAHCVHDKQQAVRNMAGMLRPGGRLILSEGVPYPGGIPWPLTWCFGLLDGWWDVGGFVARAVWTSAAKKAGLRVTSCTPLCYDGRFDVGGLIVAVK